MEFAGAEYDLLTREGVLTLHKITINPNVRTSCADAAGASTVLALVA